MSLEFVEERSDDVGGARDPLLAALIGKLPRSKTWPREDREAWLELMRAAFDVVYGRVHFAGVSEVAEAITPPSPPRLRPVRPAQLAAELERDEAAVAG